jgi:hypothetical protein
MKPLHLTLGSLLLAVLLTTTGCFRVGSDTSALRDVALDSGFRTADEKIEIGVGFFTVGLARLVTRFVEVPPEAHLALSALRHAECSVYKVKGREESLATILTRADAAMEKQHCERLVGVLEKDSLVAVYVPRGATGGRYLQASVMVLTRDQLVCVSAKAHAEDLIELAMSKINEHGGTKKIVARFDNSGI